MSWPSSFPLPAVIPHHCREGAGIPFLRRISPLPSFPGSPALQVLVLAAAMAAAGVPQPRALGAQAGLSLNFSDFVPFEYTFASTDSGGTNWQTINYRVVEEGGAKVLERRSVDEYVQNTAIPRTTWRQTIRSRSLLPDLRPLSTHVVTHQWNDSAAAWSTERVEARFLGDSVQRVAGARTSHTRALPPGVLQAELTGTVFAQFAGEHPPSDMRIRVYDVLTDTVSEVGWLVRGEETIVALDYSYRALAVVLTSDSSSVSYHLAERPRVLLGTRRIGGAADAPGQMRLVRWCSQPPPGRACGSSRPASPDLRSLPSTFP